MAVTPSLRSGIVGKGALELATIVREYLLDAPRKQGFDQCREVRGVLAVVALHSDRQGEATGVIGGREQVATGASDETHHRIERDTVPRVIRAEAFAQPLLETLAAQRVAPRMLAQNDTVFLPADGLRTHDFIGLTLLEHAVLMNTGFVRKRIGADDGLARLLANSRSTSWSGYLATVLTVLAAVYDSRLAAFGTYASAALNYSRLFKHEADHFGMRLMVAAGYPKFTNKKINLYISTGYVVRIACMALHSRRTR